MRRFGFTGPCKFSFFILFGVISVTHAATITMTVSNVSWLNAMWGSGPSEPAAGNDYVLAYVGTTNPGTMRTSPKNSTGGGNATFPGNSITVANQCRFLVKQEGGQTASINSGSGNLIANQGSRISFGANGYVSGVITLDIGQLLINGSTLIDMNESGRNNLVAGTMTGAGDVVFQKETGSTRCLMRFSNISGYTGNITVNNYIDLDFDADYEFSGRLSLGSGAALVVDRTLIFDRGKLMAGGSSVAVGTYSGTSLDQLNTSLGAVYFTNGGGTLVVVPAPTNPVPAHRSTVNVTTLTQLSWTNPATSGTKTCDVYLGEESFYNELAPHCGLPLLGQTTNNFVPISGLTAGKRYYWMVDCRDSELGLMPGPLWMFMDTAIAFDNLALYPFDNGTAGDASGRGHHGVLMGNAVITDDEEQSSKALMLDGAGDYVEVANPGELKLYNSPLTVSAWIKTTSTNQQMIVFEGKGCSSWSSWFLSIGGSENHENPGKLSFGVRSSGDSSNQRVTDPSTVPLNKWTHVAATHDGAVMRLYINGKQVSMNSTTTLPFNCSTSMFIGGDPGCSGRFWFGGRIDEVRIFDRPLDDKEILDLYAGKPDYFARTPYPEKGSVFVPFNAALQWKVYYPVDYQDVYLGTTEPLLKVAAVTAVDPAGNYLYAPVNPLAYNTTYKWRVDTFKGGQKRTGETWTFTTETAPVNADELGFDEIIFIKKKPLRSDHYYTWINNGTPSELFVAENGIYIYNVRTGQERPVITAANIPGSGKGVINYFTLSFDAQKVVFDYRQDTGSGFRIWEVNVNGTGLRQVLQPPADEAAKIARWNGGSNFHTDDIDPAYLPDGKIIFSSSRCEHTVLCGGSAALAVPVLHRVNSDGTGIEQLTRSPMSEFCPTILEDGRVMYHRFEYIDKGHRTPKTIWTMNPDGTKSQELFGLSDSYYNTGSHTNPRPVPGYKNLIVFVTAQHFPQGNCLGPIQMVDLNKDSRTSVGITNLTPNVRLGSAQEGWYFSFDNYAQLHQDGIGGPLYSDPWPINKNKTLVTHKYDWNAHYRDVAGAYAIYLIAAGGDHRLIYKDPDGTVSCWHPTPLAARPVPPKIYSFRNAGLQAEGKALCTVSNVYEGMEGVQPGTVKWLRVNESIPRYWDTRRKWSPSFTGNEWYAALWPRVQWGVVPVESDGSAYFKVPADRNIFFQALDENFREIQRERTYVNYRPGEVRSCIGCHERSGRAAPPVTAEMPIALTRAPSELQAQPCDLVAGGGDGRPAQVIHYPTQIQPMFNAKCISCHGSTSPSGNLNLTGTLTTKYSVSYEQLISKETAGRAIPEFPSITPGVGWGNDNGNYLPPKSLGCYSTKNKILPRLLTTNSSDPHYHLLNDNELMILCRWMDTNYQFYGTFYGRHHSDWSSYADFRREPTFEEAINMFAPSWHN